MSKTACAACIIWPVLLVAVLSIAASSHGALGLSLSMTTSSSRQQDGRVAVVTGASRGIGRGIALELGKAGFTVYALGRSSRSDGGNREGKYPNQRFVPEEDLTVESAAEAITAAGGRGYGIAVDLTQEGAIDRVLADICADGGRLDTLVCSAYAVPVGEKLRGNFWNQSMAMWDAVNGLGLRGVYETCRAAAPYMISTAKDSKTKGGTTTKPPPLICLVSSFGGRSYTFNVAYGVGKAAIDRLATDMSYQLAKHGVATASIYPGLVRTEANLQMEIDGTWDEASGGLDLSVGETPSFSGKAVAALTKLDYEKMMARSGNVEVVAELAKELGFTEDDGSIPPSIRSLKYLLPNFVFKQIEKETGKPIPNWIRNNVPDVLVPWSTFSSGPPPEMDTR